MVHGCASMQEKYMERDAQDVAGVRDRVPEPLQDLYLQVSAPSSEDIMSRPWSP